MSENSHASRSKDFDLGSNLVKIKARNLTAVLNALRKLQPISRSDLAASLDLTPPTMTNLVGELLDLGFIQETKTTTKKLGRPSTLLSLNPSTQTFIGLEVSRTFVSGLLTNFAGEVLQQVKKDAPAAKGAKQTLKIVQQTIKELWRKEQPPVGIGIGVPGPVDSGQGIVIKPPNFPGWETVPLASIVSERWHVPVLLDDDAKAAALGEHWFGAGQEVSNLLYLSLGTGVGSGFIVQNKLYRGTHELAGEIGHSILDLNGPRCECGNRGCLEMFVSVPAIVTKARDLGLLEKTIADTEEALKKLHLQATQGNAKALEVKEHTYRYLAAGITNAVNFYDPDLIAVGGLLPLVWPDVVAAMRSRVQGRSFGFVSKAVTIEGAALGRNSCMLGAASLVMQLIFQSPQLLGRKGTL